MVKRFIFLTTIIVLLANPLPAQESGDFPQSLREPPKSGFSLLDPNRFNMTQSYSFMYSSSRYGSQSLGLYLNSIEYQVSDPLHIRLDIGYMHNPGALVGNDSGYLGDGKILPGISITWKPADKFFLQFNYREMPVYYYSPYDRYNSNRLYPYTGRGQ
jgi:hypothetical protein